MKRTEKDEESSHAVPADPPLSDSGQDLLQTPLNLDDVIASAHSSDSDSAVQRGPKPPPLPSLGLEDEDELDISRPLPPDLLDDSAFEPETVFDADEGLNAQPPRELKIASESSVYTPEVGDVLNERFEIERLISVGNHGVVFLVRDLRLKSRKALKLMHPFLWDDPDASERFISEIKMLQKLSHEHIVRVYDYGKTDRGDLAFFTMEYIEGGTLASILKKKGGRLPLEKSIALIDQILDTLAYAHQHVCHRNIKPVNIMVRPSGKIVLLNFGISGTYEQNKVDRGATLGSAPYLAPEQGIDPNASSPQIDLYAVGVLLYQLLTGKVPLGDAAPPSNLQKSIPRRLDKVVMRMLAPRPEQRFASAAQARAAMNRATAAGGGYRMALWGVLVAIAALVCWWYYG